MAAHHMDGKTHQLNENFFDKGDELMLSVKARRRRTG